MRWCNRHGTARISQTTHVSFMLDCGSGSRLFGRSCGCHELIKLVGGHQPFCVQHDADGAQVMGKNDSIRAIDGQRNFAPDGWCAKNTCDFGVTVSVKPMSVRS